MSGTIAEARSTVLARAESQQYDETGYLLRQRAFSTAECAYIAAECESPLSDLEARKPASAAPSGSDPVNVFADLEVTVKWERALVPIEAPAGSGLFLNAFLAHRSGHNLSDRDRRTIRFSYRPAGLPQARLFRREKP